MKARQFVLLLFALTSCAHSNIATQRKLAGDQAEIDDQQWPVLKGASYAQLLLPMLPSSNKFSISKPMLVTRKGAPPIIDKKAYYTKLVNLFSDRPKIDKNSLISPSDFDQNYSEKAAQYIVSVAVSAESSQQNFKIKLTSPLKDDGSFPSVHDQLQFSPDELRPDGKQGVRLQVLSIYEVAKIISQLPFQLIGLIHDVEILSKRSPSDRVYSSLNGRPFRASMAAMAYPLGVLGIFPQPLDKLPDGSFERPNPDSSLNTFTHELGHLWSFQCFDLNPAAGLWPKWREAMKIDHVFVSAYAKSNLLDDVAETVLAYAAVQSWDNNRELAAKFKSLGVFQKEAPSKLAARWSILNEYFPRLNCGN